MLSLIDMFSIHGVWATKAIEDGMIQSAAVALLSNRWSTRGARGIVMVPSKTSTSPNMAARSNDFPDLVGPEMIDSELFGNSRLRSRRTNRFSRVNRAASASSSSRS
jgi:hypothetical protein